MIRLPAVAGHFYPAESATLRETVDSFLAPSLPPSTFENRIHVKACVVPHAGYSFSGRIAGEVFRRVDVPERVILLGPRHFPRGSSFAVPSADQWQTPLGIASVDHLLREKLLRACALLREDDVAHSSEHSLEVHLPFLQRILASFSIVPVVIASSRYEDLDVLGRAIADVIRAEPEPILLIASTDMNHYESDEITRAKDDKAIGCILAIDPRGLFNTVRDDNISMCGVGATVAMLIAVRELGATRGELLRYATSGEVNGDLDSVVGYAGIIVP